MIVGFTGDVFIGRLDGNRHIFDQVAAELGKEAALVINFEGVLSPDDRQMVAARNKILLASPVSTLTALNALPIALVSVANNHINDYGDEMALFTIKQISQRYPVFGAGYSDCRFHTYVGDFGGVRIGFASYCTADTSPIFCGVNTVGPRPFSFRQAESDLSWLSGQSRCTVAIMHWGVENFHHPRPVHVRLGRRLIETGFDIVIGHHPHTSQGYERYGKGWIFYSLGNFWFSNHRVCIGQRCYEVKWMPRKSWGLVPLFSVSGDGIHLREVKIVRQSRTGMLRLGQFPKLQRRLRRLSSDLSEKNYCAKYRQWRNVEALANRFEEFYVRDDKLAAIISKVWRMAIGLRLVGNRKRSRQN